MNKITTEIASGTLDTKLRVLMKELETSFSNGTIIDQQGVLAKFDSVLNQFFNTLDEPFLKLNTKEVKEADLISTEGYNITFSSVFLDLNILFAELANLQRLIINKFNEFTIKEFDVRHRLKLALSRLADYKLYSLGKIAGADYFSDSFSDLDKIEVDSPLLNSTQAEISEIEGIVTLPRTNDPAVKTILDIVINENSNGTPGNNQEIGVFNRNNKEVMIDSNQETWFEYERVLTSISDEPLILDMTFALAEPEVINNITVIPNNFGTSNAVKITAIDTSEEGGTRVSIKDEIPIADWTVEDEENVFSLAGPTSKFSGQGIYTFIPRTAKYIHITLEQSESISIETNTGSKLRYVIGIRSVEVNAYKYETKGEIVSSRFSSADEIKKVALLSNRNPVTESRLASIKHQISHDDGQNWIDINPVDLDSIDIDEIVNFNVGVVEGTVETDLPVKTLRHKAILERNTSEFSNATVEKSIVSQLDSVLIPKSPPFNVGLTQIPITGTAKVLYTIKGRIGTSKTPMIVGKTKNISGQRSTYRLPVRIKTIDSEIIRIRNKLWSRVDNLSSVTTSDSYELDYVNNTITFGDGINGNQPPDSSVIELFIEDERLLISPSSPHTSELEYNSDGTAKDVVLYRLDPPVTITAEPIQKGSTIIQLRNSNISGTISFTSNGVLAQNPFAIEKTFEDGARELTNNGDYSVNTETGIIYTKLPIPSDINMTATYTYIPKIIIPETKWKFESHPIDALKHISISDDVYSVVDFQELLTVDSRVIQMSNVTIVPRSVVFDDTTKFNIEVPFVDGTTEFLLNIPTDGYYSIDYMNGTIYLAPTTSIDVGNYNTSTINYKYSSYFIQYNMATQIDRDLYTVDEANKTISFDDSIAVEILGKDLLGDQPDVLIKLLYDFIKSESISIQHLEPFFTPVLKDYALATVPAGQLRI